MIEYSERPTSRAFKAETALHWIDNRYISKIKASLEVSVFNELYSLISYLIFPLQENLVSFQ
jgi:hypothetical protein